MSRHAFGAFLMVCLVVSAAQAQQRQVPSSTLSALGLSGMNIVSDAEGMQVRGMSGNAFSRGHSLVQALVVDPSTSSFIFGSDTNGARTSAENGGANVVTQVNHNHASSVNVSLNVVTLTSSFTGVLFGGAGGSGFASSH